jgi:L-lactate dehydrogenase complex protein LldG
MASKDEILRELRTNRPPRSEAPTPFTDAITYADRRAQFASVLESVGGRCVYCADRAGINAALQTLPGYATAKKIVSLVPGIGTPNVDLGTINDPHDLADVDFAILSAKFGVAENGAVWVPDEGVRHRVVAFITQHLALVIENGEIVDNMHQAYERVSFPGPSFGLFLSGPSKTADIEQSLVIGAHGPRSLTVFCL